MSRGYHIRCLVKDCPICDRPRYKESTMSTYRRWLKEPPQYEPDIGFLADARDDLLIEFAKAALPTAWEVLVNARDQGFEKAPEESEIDNLAKVTFIIASKLLAEYERRVRES